MLVHRLDRGGEDDAAATLRGAIDRLRAICADLRLPVIHDLGLAAALEALVGEVRAASGIDIDLRYDGEAAAAVRRRARALPHRTGGRRQRHQARPPADHGPPPRRAWLG